MKIILRAALMAVSLASIGPAYAGNPSTQHATSVVTTAQTVQGYFSAP